tara:strand:- start:967 stop:2712 length:1746 start_codon:yes stop_codon:yes gene_type:complete
MMLKKINLYIIILLIFLSYVVINLSFNHYNVIDFLDHDEGFLIEQLALKIGIFNINRTVSSITEYGADFYYFKYFFLLLNNFVDLNLIDVFRIKTLINTCLATLSYVLIYKIFDLLRFKKIFYFLFFISIISIPEVFRLSVTLKQDLNLLFFLLTLTYYFFLKASIYKIQSDAYLFLIFLSLSLSIKAWAFPFIFLLFFDKFNYSNNKLKSYKLIFSGLIICFIFLLNLYFFEIKNFILSDEDFITFYDLNKYNLFLKTSVIVFTKYFIYLIIFLNIFFLIFMKIIFLQKKFKDFFLKFFIFFMIWFILWYPYISDLSTFTKTIIEDSLSTVLNKNSNAYTGYENILFYFIYDLQNLKLNLSIFIIFIISPALMYFYKSNLSEHFKVLIPFLSLCILCLLFVNFITDYDNQYPAKNLYFIFLNIFIFYLINALSKKKLLYFSFISIFLLTSFISIFLNFDKYLNYKNFMSINDKIISLTNFHQQKLNLEGKDLYVCATNYPVDSNKSMINIINKSSGECLEKQFILNLNKDDLIFFESSPSRSESFLKQYKLYYEDYHHTIDRFGRIINKQNQFYKKFNNE